MSRNSGPKGSPPDDGSGEVPPGSTVSLRQHGAPASDSGDALSVATPPSKQRPSSPPRKESSDEKDPRVGQKFGKYLLSRLIGIGGMAQVYEADDTLLNRRVAVKFLTETRRQQTTAVERFINEAQVAGRLNHPNIIAIYDIGFEHDTYYIAMELLNPGSAGSFVKHKGRMHWVEAAHTIMQCCSALESAHKAGIIHRDIKPDNILCSPAGAAKLADFGLVKELHLGESTGLTQSGVVVGTPLFMSPEQCTAQPLDARSDIYSLGCTFYALLTGSPPFPTGSVPQIMLQHCKSRVPDPRVLASDVPESIVKTIEKSTAKRADDRYQNAHDFHKALAAVLEDAPRPTFEFLVLGTTNRTPPRQRGSGAARLRSESGPRTPDSQGSPGGPKLPTPSLENPPEHPPEPEPSPPGMSRRKALLGGLGLLGAAVGVAFWKWQQPVEKPQPVVNLPPIKIGVLNSQSGFLFDSGRPVIDATLLAIEEINNKGGLLGRKIEPIVADGKSDNRTFALEADRLLSKDKVVAIFGGWSPSNRRALKKVIEKHKSLLMFPARDEGMEDSEYIIYSGSSPNQIVSPAIRIFAGAKHYKRLYVIGSDGLASNISTELLKDELKNFPQTQIVGETFEVVGERNFEKVIPKIELAKPDLIFNFMIGESNPAFFKALRAKKILPNQIPTVNFAIGEPELQQIAHLDMVGEYLAASYFQTIPSEENKAFVARFRRKYGDYRMTGATMESAYASVYLWAQAVAAAGTDEVARVRERLAGQTFLAPSGKTTIDPGNHHCHKSFFLGRIGEGNVVEIVGTPETYIRPEPFPPTRTRTQWEAFIDEKSKSWGGAFVNENKPNK
ncbi:MAG TPA: transporter substrate-binding protein [Pseudomonadota bacterium]|nr:transporter substrate-binding protein [Pseudomonadota bacterium]